MAALGSAAFCLSPSRDNMELVPVYNGQETLSRYRRCPNDGSQLPQLASLHHLRIRISSNEADIQTPASSRWRG